MTRLVASFTQVELYLRIIALLIAAVIGVSGCGGGSTYSSTSSSPDAQNATVTAQYNLVLTSTNGRGTTNIYADFTQATSCRLRRGMGLWLLSLLAVPGASWERVP
jgi:uncharacterized protein YceK